MQSLYHNRWGKTIYVTIIVVLLVAIIMLALYLYWLLSPSDVLDIKNNPVPFREKLVTSGSIQILQVDFCKNLDVQGFVTPSLVSNKEVIFLPSYIDTLKPICEKKYGVPVSIPYVPHADRYHIHYHIVYKINPVRTTIVEFDSQPFRITP